MTYRPKAFLNLDCYNCNKVCQVLFFLYIVVGPLCYQCQYDDELGMD